MNSNAMAQSNGSNGTTGDVMERVIALGDLEALKPMERAVYYNRICESLGLNPLTQPLQYIRLSGKLTLYARRDATDQLRKIHRVSIIVSDRVHVDDLYIVTARATTPDGRTDESTGAVCLAGLKGENLANAIMKAETKAKRRVTLSICGLGFLDETEVQDVPGAKPVLVTSDGEIVDPPKALPLATERSEEQWNEWAERHTANMNRAESPGAMKEAYMVAMRDARVKGAPQGVVKALEDVKDKLKALWSSK